MLTSINFPAHLHKFEIKLLVRFHDDTDNQRFIKTFSATTLGNDKMPKSWVTGLKGIQGVTLQNLFKRICVILT